MKETAPVAIFYQAAPPPAINGIKKPYKAGGYSDSGADIGFALKSKGLPVITPSANPDSTIDMDWVFPDTVEGFAQAYEKGARLFWLNTVLYATHPVTKLSYPDVRFVGQNPASVEKFDDKFQTNKMLRDAGLQVAESVLISSAADIEKSQLTYPVVLKPIRGRGSQGVVVCKNLSELTQNLNLHLASGLYGDEFILEEMLAGTEITVTVMPPGTYELGGQTVVKAEHWFLPPVARFNHVNGIAPYNGVVAVVKNSKVVDDLSQEVKSAAIACVQAAKSVGALAPIRIDCRQNAQGTYKLFDLNLKPNLTGSGRPGREDQDSLLLMSAKAAGWDYADFLLNILQQAWKK